MPAGNLDVRVRLLEARTAQIEAAKTERAISRIGTSAGRAGRASKEGGRGVGLLGRAVGGLKFAAGVAGIGGLVIGIKDAVSAGTEAQANQAALAVAIKNTGQAVGPMSKAVNSAVESLSTHGGFAPPEQIQSIAKLTSETGSATKAIGLNKAATDLARGAHIGYDQAIMAVQQATVGNTRRLQRYVGILVPSTSHVHALTAAQKKLHPELAVHAQLLDKQANATLAVSRIQQKFAGQTTAFSHTAAGAMSNARNAVQLLLEQLGKMLLPLVAKVAKAISIAAGFIAHHMKQIQSVAKTVFGVVKTIVVGAFNAIVAAVKTVVGWLNKHKTTALILKSVIFGLVAAFAAYKAIMIVVTIVTRAFAVVQGILDAVLAANPIVLVVIALVALAAAFVYAYKHSQAFRNILDKVFTFIKSAVRIVAEVFKVEFMAIKAVIVVVVAILRVVGSVVATVFGAIKRVVTTVAPIVAGAIGGVSTALGVVISAVRTVAQPFIDAFNAIKRIVTSVVGWVVGKIKDLISTLGDAVTAVTSFLGITSKVSSSVSPGKWPALPKGASGPTPLTSLVPGAQQPQRATPGGRALHRQVVSNSQAAVTSFGAPAGGGAAQAGRDAEANLVPGTTKVYIGSRQVAEAVTQYQRTRQARR